MPTLTVNGKPLTFEADPDTPLLWVIREQLGLTGTKYGCGVAQCGACTVHLDGQALRSCSAPATVAVGRQLTTIEGLSPAGQPEASHVLQRSWAALDVPQCGFCQSGMLMAAAALLAAKPQPTDTDIDLAMTNICRCGTYNRVRAAIKLAAAGGPKTAAAPPNGVRLVEAPPRTTATAGGPAA